MSKKFKKWLIILAAITLVLFIIYLIVDEPIPEGTSGPHAEALADKMLNALNKEGWDTTYAVQWTFADHHYLWDRKHNLVKVEWDDYRVLLNTKELQGRSFHNSAPLEGEEHNEAIRTAWKYFANDSFWLIAPYKIRDPGTERYLVRTDEGDALMVHYTSGGITPGDTYLWLLHDDGTPKAWKLWVQIIPVGGMQFSWENWNTYSTGARIASFHDGIFDLQLTNIAVANDVKMLNGGTDPFQ